MARRGFGVHVYWVHEGAEVTAAEQAQWVSELALKNDTWPRSLAATDEVVTFDYTCPTANHVVPHLPPNRFVFEPSQAAEAAYLAFTQNAECHNNYTVVKPFPSTLLEYQQALWVRNGGNEIEPLLKTGAFALLDAHWLIAHFEVGGRIRRRQDLPADAFISINELKAAGSPDGGLALIMVSYCWLQPNEPDPKRFTAGRLAQVLKTLGALRPISIHNHAATSFGPGGTQRWGIFLDFSSLHQHSRTRPRCEAEERLFKTALNALDQLYSHPRTLVLRFTALPDGYPSGYNLPKDANVAEYGQRGWPVFETACAALVKGSNKCLDVGRLPMSADCPRAYHPLVKACTAGDARPVPQLPEQFDESSTRLRFTNGHEDGPLTRKLYSAAFFQRLGGAKKLGYSHLGWHDADAQQLARIIRAHVLVNVVALDLRFNRFTAEGVRALAASISTETLPRLQTLALDGNADIGDKGARSIADMIARGAVPRLSNLLSLEGCGLGDAAIQLVAAALTPETTPLLDDVSVRNNHHSSSAQEALERSLCALRASRWRLQMLEA